MENFGRPYGFNIHCRWSGLNYYKVVIKRYEKKIIVVAHNQSIYSFTDKRLGLYEKVKLIYKLSNIHYQLLNFPFKIKLAMSQRSTDNSLQLVNQNIKK
ncbi:hypothetical protein BpHYR1_002147 [Brachionus plicatilis]|uniref:Uncharacterized protein n=1 Tax=Brachionus plicatilis TaxID=10195 RepID=A0A3M7QB06_BRAPC|nr:hypothetical protein BpHYR1_002147 [Brachionus plicatilis]